MENVWPPTGTEPVTYTELPDVLYHLATDEASDYKWYSTYIFYEICDIQAGKCC